MSVLKVTCLSLLVALSVFPGQGKSSPGDPTAKAFGRVAEMEANLIAQLAELKKLRQDLLKKSRAIGSCLL